MKISAWDRALVSLFPAYGANRLRARAAVENLSRHFEAAVPGRRTQNQRKDPTDADFALRSASRDLRFASRDLIRNNGWARRARAIIANNTIGWGITPKATGPNEAANKIAQDIWRRWGATTECESDNRQTFYGVQRLGMKNLFSDGEYFIRRRYRRKSDGLTVPLQIQVLEADYLNTAWNFIDSSGIQGSAGGPIIQGVEFDKLGRRAAYWMWSQHPGSGRSIEAPKRIPAEEIIHVYDVERAGQTRGVSWLAAAILNLGDLDQYEDAELMKQKIAACFAAFVTDTEGDGGPIGEVNSPTDDLVETFEPGMIHQLPPNKQITMATPPVMTADTLPTRTLRKFAAGISVTYEDLTGDYSNVNFSSARMGRIAHQAAVCAWQEDMVIPILCNGVWGWVMEAAQLAGLISDSEPAPMADWTTPPLPMLEPDKEGLALTRLVRGGAMTPSQMVREQGRDPDEHWAEYAADMTRLDGLGIKLDTDVRAVSQTGQAQTAVPGEPPEPTAPEPPKPGDRVFALFRDEDHDLIEGRAVPMAWADFEGRFVVAVDGGFVVMDHTKSKRLSKIYTTKAAAEKRLKEIEYFKAAK